MSNVSGDPVDRATNKRLSTVQIDLDGLWVLERLGGRLAEVANDPVFEVGLPRFLELFARHDIRATFFVNAADLEVSAKRVLLERVMKAGHEIANHGWTHRYLTALDSGEKEKELVESTETLSRFTGRPLRGFRAAGYAVDAEVPGFLERLGYAYDSSAFPTSLLPVIGLVHRAFISPPRPHYPWMTPLFSPSVPYRPAVRDLYRRGGARLLEVPVTTLPLFRIPLHFSYGMLLGSHYMKLGVRWALRRLRCVNFVFHLVDLADCSGVSLGRLGRKRVDAEDRLAAADNVLALLCGKSEVLPTGALCERLTGASGL